MATLIFDNSVPAGAHDQIRDAFDTAKAWATKVNKDFLKWNADNASLPRFNQLVNTYLGSRTDARYTAFDSSVRRIKNYLDGTENLIISFNGSPDEEKTYAYTSFNSGKLTLCRKFFSAPATGTDSAPGTILHELTHLLQNTDDHEYGKTKTKALASQSPHLAMRNADNFEYFCEDYCSN